MNIVGLYAGLCALLMLVLAMRVMWLRNTRRVGIGTGDDPQLARAIRAHANATEYVPLALLMLLLLALEAVPSAWLHGFGALLVVARILHALGLSASPARSFGRVTGAGLTVLLMGVMAVMLVVHYFG